MTERDEFAGKLVFTWDHEQLGTVVDVVTTPSDPARRYLVVKSPLYGTGSYYVPEAEVDGVRGDRVMLKTSRDDLAQLDWFNPPEGIGR